MSSTMCMNGNTASHSNTAPTVRIRKICDERRCKTLKVDVKVKFIPEQAKRGNTGIALIFNLRARRGWVFVMSQPLHPWERPSTHCKGGWVGPRAILERCKKSRPTGIQSPEYPARSKLLY